MSRSTFHSHLRRRCNNMLILILSTATIIYSFLPCAQSLCGDKLCLAGECNATTAACTCSVNFPNCSLEGNVTCAGATSFCSENSTCIDMSDGDISCNCSLGFTGVQCESQTCDSSFCSDNGSCTIDGSGNQTCSCSEGWFGDRCDRDKNDCAVDAPCHNGANCTDLPSGYSCACTPGWEGLDCNIDVDECSLDYCPPETTNSCNNTDGSYSCVCGPGYTGDNCTEPSCASPSLCYNGGECQSNATHWSCLCQPFYEGDRCGNKGPCVDIPCQNNGTCSQANVSGSWQYECACKSGWTNALTCADDVNECLNSTLCQNGAQCVNEEGSFLCNCTEFWTGEVCAEDVKECSQSTTPCLVDVCLEEEGSYSCDCAGTGRRGRHCELNDWCFTSCSISNTVNGSSCVNLEDRADCTCTEEYLKPDCKMEDPCFPNPCQNQGECMFAEGSLTNKTVCKCPDKFTGAICEDSEFDWVVAVAVPLVVAVAVAVIVGLIICFVMAKKKRATRGRYSPSRNEIIGPNLQMSGVLKPPPEERLI